MPKFIFKCTLRTARLTYVYIVAFVANHAWRYGRGSTVSDKNVANELWFQSTRGLYKFSPGFTAEVRRTAVEPLNLVIIHIMQHHLSDILRCVAIWNMYYYESS